jgi:cephalosporin hydroxylase
MLERVRKARHRYRTTPKDVRRHYRMHGRQWLFHLQSELMERESHWMGIRALKNPLDAWVYQEILHEVQPTAVVELGSAFGGGTLFLCHMLDLLDLEAPVITVAHYHGAFAADHLRITKVTGDSGDRGVIDEVRDLCADRRVLLIHDASHDAAVVLSDLRNYSPLVAPGSYLIVEDGVTDTIGGQPGPLVAVNRFLRESADFEIDTSRERFLLSYNPRGFLRRRSTDDSN